MDNKPINWGKEPEEVADDRLGLGHSLRGLQATWERWLGNNSKYPIA